MADNNSQYLWRQRKKRNARLTVWIILVILFSAVGTFVFEGMRSSDPKRTAEKYFMENIGVEGYTVEEGERTLNKDNQFVQSYTFQYTADGAVENTAVSLTQQNEKKYGLFEQWKPQIAAAETADLELIAPAGSQVLIDGVRPDAASIKEDETLSPGAVCYRLTGVDPNAKLQVNGLPFESYEGTLQTSGSVLDVRNMLSVSENAKTQMEELGKSMINELYSAAFAKKEASELGEDFARLSNRENLYRAITKDLFQDGELKVEKLSFSGFKPEFEEVEYPGKDGESYVGIDMTLAYTCSVVPANGEDSDGEEETWDDQTEEPQSEETDGESQETQELKKEAVFSFRYQDGNCTVYSAEIPGI